MAPKKQQTTQASWFGFFGSTGDGPKKKPHKIHLGESKNDFYYNEELKAWVERGQEEAMKQQLKPPPPPKSSDLSKQKPQSGNNSGIDGSESEQELGPPIREMSRGSSISRQPLEARYALNDQVKVAKSSAKPMTFGAPAGRVLPKDGPNVFKPSIPQGGQAAGTNHYASFSTKSIQSAIVESNWESDKPQSDSRQSSGDGGQDSDSQIEPPVESHPLDTPALTPSANSFTTQQPAMFVPNDSKPQSDQAEYISAVHSGRQSDHNAGAEPHPSDNQQHGQQADQYSQQVVGTESQGEAGQGWGDEGQGWGDEGVSAESPYAQQGGEARDAQGADAGGAVQQQAGYQQGFGQQGSAGAEYGEHYQGVEEQGVHDQQQANWQQQQYQGWDQAAPVQQSSDGEQQYWQTPPDQQGVVGQVPEAEQYSSDAVQQGVPDTATSGGSRGVSGEGGFGAQQQYGYGEADAEGVQQGQYSGDQQAVDQQSAPFDMSQYPGMCGPYFNEYGQEYYYWNGWYYCNGQWIQWQDDSGAQHQQLDNGADANMTESNAVQGSEQYSTEQYDGVQQPDSAHYSQYDQMQSQQTPESAHYNQHYGEVKQGVGEQADNAEITVHNENGKPTVSSNFHGKQGVGMPGEPVQWDARTQSMSDLVPPSTDGSFFSEAANRGAGEDLDGQAFGNGQVSAAGLDQQMSLGGWGDGAAAVKGAAEDAKLSSTGVSLAQGMALGGEQLENEQSDEASKHISAWKQTAAENAQVGGGTDEYLEQDNAASNPLYDTQGYSMEPSGHGPLGQPIAFPKTPYTDNTTLTLPSPNHSQGKGNVFQQLAVGDAAAPVEAPQAGEDTQSPDVVLQRLEAAKQALEQLKVADVLVGIDIDSALGNLETAMNDIHSTGKGPLQGPISIPSTVANTANASPAAPLLVDLAYVSGIGSHNIETFQLLTKDLLQRHELSGQILEKMEASGAADLCSHPVWSGNLTPADNSEHDEAGKADNDVCAENQFASVTKESLRASDALVPLVQQVQAQLDAIQSGQSVHLTQTKLESIVYELTKTLQNTPSHLVLQTYHAQQLAVAEILAPPPPPATHASSPQFANKTPTTVSKAAPSDIHNVDSSVRIAEDGIGGVISVDSVGSLSESVRQLTHDEMEVILKRMNDDFADIVVLQGKNNRKIKLISSFMKKAGLPVKQLLQLVDKQVLEDDDGSMVMGSVGGDSIGNESEWALKYIQEALTSRAAEEPRYNDNDENSSTDSDIADIPLAGHHDNNGRDTPNSSPPRKYDPDVMAQGLVVHHPQELAVQQQHAQSLNPKTSFSSPDSHKQHKSKVS